LNTNYSDSKIRVPTPTQVMRQLNIADSRPSRLDEYYENGMDGQSSRLGGKKSKRPIIGELNGGLLDLTPWHEDRTKQERDRKRYNNEGAANIVNSVLLGAEFKLNNDGAI
jgi:hypothetical protein